MITCEFL